MTCLLDVRARLRRAATGLLDCLLPPTCAACGCTLPAPPGPQAPGRNAMTPLPRTICARCWRALAIRPPDPEMLGDLEIRAAFEHRGPGRQLVHAFKYQGRTDAARVIAELTVAGYRRHGRPACDWIVPVPLHRRRLLRRGYNQSHLLAAELGERLDRPVRDALRRRFATRTQTRLSAIERRRNVSAAFASSAGRLGGRWRDGMTCRGARVLLVDDVVTTGATATAAASMLRRLGARTVVVQVAARAPLGPNAAERP